MLQSTTPVFRAERFLRHGANCRGRQPILVVAILAALSAAPSTADAQDDELEALLRRGNPGLVVTWSDVQTEIAGVAPRLAFRLDGDESPHPQIAAGPFTARYAGRLYCVRPGAYRFGAQTSGDFQLSINDRRVLSVADGKTVAESAELPYGPVELTAEFQHNGDGPATLAVDWTKEGEWPEPISSASLEHLSAHRTPALERAQLVERGRRAFAELRCGNCHASAADGAVTIGLATPRAPILTGIGARARREWLYHWLDRPHRVRPTAAMPELFGESAGERVDLYAASAYLAAEIGPDRLAPDGSETAPAADEVAREESAVELGHKLFATRGCIACHLAPGEERVAHSELVSIDGAGSKTSRDKIAAWIRDPHEFHPDSRMPDFQFESSEPETLAALSAYIAQSRDPSVESIPAAPSDAEVIARLHHLVDESDQQVEFRKLAPAARLHELGLAVIQSRGCLNCHELGSLKPSTASTPLADVAASFRTPRDLAAPRVAGCLSESGTPRTNIEGGGLVVPSYALDAEMRDALAAFLGNGVVEAAHDRRLGQSESPPQHFAPGQDVGPRDPQSTQHSTNNVSHAPLFELEHRLDRLGCTACHRRDGRGGAFAERVLNFVELGTDQTILDLAPPELSSVGEKLRVEAMANILSGKVRARPWMEAKMPHFAAHQIGGLAELLARADGVDPVQEPLKLAKRLTADRQDNEVAAVGRLLVGRTGLNCVSCHDIRGVKSSGVRGPDLAQVASRVTHEWFERWLLDPQRVTQGTRMPTVFFGGRSAAPQYFGGDPSMQLAALWAYLSQGERLEPPIMTATAPVLVEGGENPRLPIKDKPLVVHGFMRDHAGLRGVALGFPAGVHFAYDAERCLLTEAWSGDFVEVGGWYGSGRGSADDNGARVLGEVFWRFPQRTPAIVAARDDLAAEAKAAEAFTAAVNHRAVWGTRDDAGFAYELRLAGGASVEVKDRPRPIDGIDEPAFVRRLEVSGAGAGRVLWLCVADDLEGKGQVELFNPEKRATQAWPMAARITSRSVEQWPWIGVSAEGDAKFVKTLASQPGACWVRRGDRLWIRWPLDDAPGIELAFTRRTGKAQSNEMAIQHVEGALGGEPP